MLGCLMYEPLRHSKKMRRRKKWGIVWLSDAIGDQDRIRYRTQVQFHVPRKSYHKSMSMRFIDKTNNDKQIFNPIFIWNCANVVNLVL